MLIKLCPTPFSRTGDPQLLFVHLSQQLGHIVQLLSQSLRIDSPGGSSQLLEHLQRLDFVLIHCEEAPLTPLTLLPGVLFRLKIAYSPCPPMAALFTSATKDMRIIRPVELKMMT